MKLTISQMQAIFKLLPDGTNLPHGSTHTFNMADRNCQLPISFYSGQIYLTFTWSTSLKEWSLEIPHSENL